MATLEDIVAATKILSEDPESIMGDSVSKQKENGAMPSDVRKIDGDSVLTEQVVETETITSVRANGVDIGMGVDGSTVGVFESDGKSWADNGKDKGTRYEKSNNMDGDGEGEGEGEGEGDGEKLNDNDYKFCVGDLVWGKIRSHPWWPGQVCDPNDASEFALERKQEGRLLVAFFGDGSCSWCLPSQLIPFVENVSEMATNSSSKSFLNAVERAADEVGRLMELEMTCKCVPEEKKVGLARQVAVNAGLKAGVMMPEVDYSRLSLPKYEPVELLEKVKKLAKAASFDSALELAVLRSGLSAFYCFKGGYQLPVYHEPIHIEGLEDKSKNVNEIIRDDFSVPIEVPIMGPRDDDGLSSPTDGTVNSHPLSDDKVSHKRKQKSVAELMGETKDIKPETRKRATVKEKTDLEKPTSSRKRKKKNDGEVDGVGSEGASSKGKAGTKRKVKASESTQLTNVKVLNAENGGFVGADGVKAGKPKEIEVANAENASGEAREELEEVSTPRERKKSKYLSPPYTNPAWKIGNSSFKKESKIENDNITKMSTPEATIADLSESQPVSKSVDKASEKKPANGQLERLDISVDTIPETIKNERKMTFSVSDVDAPVNELLSEIHLAAVDPPYLSKECSLDMVCAFISALRSSTYLHGPDYKIFQKSKTAGKRKKSQPSQLEDIENDITTKKAKSSDQSTPKDKSKKAVETSGAKAIAEEEGKNLPCLILTFAPEFPLPSKEDIVKLFSKFGSLNKRETKVVTDSHSVKIVYMKDSDAEAAFKSSLSQSPFGFENVSYKLQHSSSRSRSRKSHPKVSSPLKRPRGKRDSTHHGDELVSDVGVIRRKLDIMTAILENYHSKFSLEEKSSLKDEMKQLMEKVETISEKVGFLAENASS